MNLLQEAIVRMRMDEKAVLYVGTFAHIHSSTFPLPTLAPSFCLQSTLQQACMEQGIKWVEDPSNADTRYQRNAIRSFLTGQGLQGSKGCPLDLESTRAFFQRMNRHRHEIDQQGKWKLMQWINGIGSLGY